MICSFATFADEVRRKHLTPKDCGRNHWQILGGKFSVNFYPFALAGPSYYINGFNCGSRFRVTVADAIAAANNPPIDKLHWRTRDRKRSYRVAKRRLLAQRAVCHWCPAPLDYASATLDHLIPLSRGGSNSEDNFVLACEECNKSRRNKMPDRMKHAKEMR